MTLQYVWSVISFQVIPLGCFILPSLKHNSIFFTIKTLLSLPLETLEEAWNNNITELEGRSWQNKEVVMIWLNLSKWILRSQNALCPPHPRDGAISLMPTLHCLTIFSLLWSSTWHCVNELCTLVTKTEIYPKTSLILTSGECLK